MAVAVVIVEEWPMIKETYHEVRARRRRRMSVVPHEHHHLHLPTEEVAMAASGIHEPLQEMTMRSRNTVHPLTERTNQKDVKSGVQVLRPFALNPTEISHIENVANEDHVLIPSLQRDESSTRFPIFTQDVSPLIHRATSPNKPLPASPPLIPDTSDTPILDQRSVTPEFINQHPVVPKLELINPVDRASTPALELEDPFADPAISESEVHGSQYEDAHSAPMSRATSHTLSIHEDAYDEINSMSDWTEAFESESDGPTDVESDSDVVSDAESEASWARVRGSRSTGVN